MSLRQDEVEFEDGRSGTYAVINRQDGVAVLVAIKKEKVLLIKQHRYPIDKFSWELPGGGIDAGESLEEAAKRELHEEIGLVINDLEKVGEYYPLHSQSTEKGTLFVAWLDEEPNNLKPETDDGVETLELMEIEEAVRMVEVGEINDVFSAFGVMWLKHKLGKEPG